MKMLKDFFQMNPIDKDCVDHGNIGTCSVSGQWKLVLCISV